jgi:hypothetical protein
MIPAGPFCGKKTPVGSESNGIIPVHSD